MVSVMSSKWYNLELWTPEGMHSIEFPDMGNYEKLGSPYVDHVPNPKHVVLWAESMGYELDEMSLEVMIGRWALEVEGWKP